MQIRHNELEIPSNDPFQYDKLKRDKLEPPLTEFITQASGSLVLALDGCWGSGKTTFLNMWKVKLEQKGHACLYLNAWKNDFVQDPLVAVIGELSSAIEKFAKRTNSQHEKFQNIEKVKEFGIKIAKRAAITSVKLATYGVLDLDAAIERTGAEFTQGIAEDLITEYETGKTDVKNFRESLLFLVKEIQQNNSEAKVIIIIDELDRCRPTFAVQLLERIKHLFDVEGIVFILGIDRSQLNHSIRALYGSDFDAQGYLRRFIDVDYCLPKPEPKYYCSYLFSYFGIDEMVLKRKQNGQDELNMLKIVLESLMTASGMSLREQEQTVARLRIVLQTIPLNNYLFPITLSMLLFLREWEPKTYTSLLAEKICIEVILNSIDQLPYSQEASKEIDANYYSYRDAIEALLICSMKEVNVTITSKEFDVSLSSLEKFEQIKSKTKSTVRELIEIILRKGGSGLKKTRDRLEIADQFVLQEES